MDWRKTALVTVVMGTILVLLTVSCASAPGGSGNGGGSSGGLDLTGEWLDPQVDQMTNGTIYTNYFGAFIGDTLEIKSDNNINLKFYNNIGSINLIYTATNYAKIVVDEANKTITLCGNGLFTNIYIDPFETNTNIYYFTNTWTCTTISSTTIHITNVVKNRSYLMYDDVASNFVTNFNSVGYGSEYLFTEEGKLP